MSRTYMVPSSMVSNNSMINAWLFVLLIPLEDYVRVLVVSVGVLFNIYVRLSAERELETIGKFLRTRTTVIQQRKNELGVIARSFWNSLKQRLSVSSMVTDLKDLIEKMFAYLRKAIMGTKSKNGGVPKIKLAISNESFKSPDPSSLHCATPVNRVHSDPVRRLDRKISKYDGRSRVQSPELFKNKIYKAKMNL